MGGGCTTGRRISQQNQRKQVEGSDGWLLNVCVTALAAGTLVAFGHWFSSTPGRRLGDDKGRALRREEAIDNVPDEAGKKRKNQTNPKSLAELRQRRLQAAEARLQSTRMEPSAARLTPLGMILELTQKVDMLEEETNLFLAKVSSRVMTSLEEKSEVQLLERLALLQLEIDAIQGDESVRPHRKRQTNRIQMLVHKLDQPKQDENSVVAAITEAGTPQT